MKKEISYSEAINEIEEILAKLAADNVDVDSLSMHVKRASELITLCKKKLRKAEEDVAKIIEADK